MIVIIDDERTFLTRGEEAVYLRTSQEALAWFAKYIIRCELDPAGSVPKIDEIWFDHDLGEASDDDAVIVAKFIAVIMNAYGYDDNCLEVVDVFNHAQLFVHTQNPVEAENIVNAFRHKHNKPQIVALPELKPPEPRSGKMKSITVMQKSDADYIVERMKELLNNYAYVSIADFKTLIGLSHNYEDNKWGWSDLTEAEVKQTHPTNKALGWTIQLPEPKKQV